MAGGAIAAAEGINKVVVLAKTVLELSKKAANLELQELIMQLREAVLEAKEEVLALRDENRALKELLQAQTEWNSKASAYRLVKTDGGAIVMYTAGPPEHFACPTCFAEKSLQFLQDSNKLDGHFYCPGKCGGSYPIRRSRSPAAAKPPVRIENDRMP